MSKLLYGFFYVLSLLPMFILYGIGDIIFVIFYYLVGYRKEVVWNNLKIAFPEKTDKELESIRRKCFRNFIHTWIETVKFISISDKQLNKMVTGDFSLIEKLRPTQPRITWLSGHFMNWELFAIYPAKHISYPYLGVYMPLTNKAFDDLFIKIRGRSGVNLLRAGNMRTDMMPWRNKDYVLVLGADQNPPNPNNAVWLNFFGQPTAFVTGPEKNARAGNTAVIFSWMEKTGLGKYVFHVELLCEDPSLLEKNEIQRRYVKRLEEIITLHPDNYLWTHKRWKHSWKKEYENLWIDTVPPPEVEG